MTLDRRWWQHKRSKEMHAGLWKAYTHARSMDQSRPEAFRCLRSFYSQGAVLYEVGSETTGHIKVSRHNLLASVVDTAETKVLDHRPDPMILTSGGSAKLQKQAAGLAKWTKAAARQEGLYRVVEKAGREMLICGTGAYRVFERAGRPAYEIVYCDQVFVDPLEAYNDAVMTYYWERHVDRSVLLSMYPEAKDVISKASVVVHTEVTPDGLPSTLAGTSDMVLVVQAYRVAASDREGDEGRMVVATEHGILCEEDYESEAAPFVFMRWRERPREFWGIGLGEMMAGIQDQIDRHQETVDESLDSMPPSTWVQAGTVKRSQIDDGIARIYEYDGANPPILFSPGAAAVQGHADRERYLTELTYQLAGVSSMEAGAQKPAGLNSGRAQLVHQDIKSARLRRQAQQVEDAYVEGFRRTIEVADCIVSDRDDDDEDDAREVEDRLRYLAGKGKDLDEVSFSDVRMKDTLYRVTIFPVSKLPDSPAGRLDRVVDMLNAGMVSPEEGMSLLDFPDLDAFIESRSSQRDHAHFLVDRALEGKDAATWLTSDDDLAEVMRYGKQQRARAILMADTESADDAFASVAQLRELLAACTALQTQKLEAQQAATAAAAPPAPPAMPPGVPPMGGI
jgi:hypothetical protein